MIHLVSENFQTMLFLFFFFLPFKLPCLPLLPSPLQHIWPKLHPKGNTKGADIRREQPPLRHRHGQHYLSLLPQHASRLWGGFMELLSYHAFLSLSQPPTPKSQHHYLVLMPVSVSVSFSTLSLLSSTFSDIITYILSFSLFLLFMEGT